MSAAAALAQMFIPKAEALAGLHNGTLVRKGSVIYHAGGGIHSHMQETAAFDPAKLLNQMTDMSKQMAGVTQSLQLVKVLQVANVALSAVDIGVSVVGFTMMNAKLKEVRSDILNVSATIESMREERFSEDFVMLSTFVERFEEAWLWRNIAKAEDEWRAICTDARRFQDLFEYRARQLLHTSQPCHPLADRMIDALAMVGGLRVSAAMAADEGELAVKISDQCAEQIVALTGGIGLVDLVRPHLPPAISPGSSDWPKVLAEAGNEARPLFTKFRERETRAATRSPPIALLTERGITPHQWLKIAREEREEPLLMLGVR